jgi:hypothetical protein
MSVPQTKKYGSMNFIVPVLKKLTSKGVQIKILRAQKLYQLHPYLLWGDYNLKNISLNQKDEDIQEVSRPAACLLHKPVKECDYHT